jgi:hypothetical protein
MASPPDRPNEESPSNQWERRQLAHEEWVALTFLAFGLLAILWLGWILVGQLLVR